MAGRSWPGREASNQRNRNLEGRSFLTAFPDHIQPEIPRTRPCQAMGRIPFVSL